MMKHSLILVLAGLIATTTAVDTDSHQWDAYCYEWQCIALNPERNRWPDLQYANEEEGETIQGNYRKMIKNVLADNVRLSADPDSY